jgi:hypothetical protein
MIKAKRRRLDTAVEGQVFASQSDLARRWGCTLRTAATRIKAAGIPKYFFAATSVRYSLKDVIDYENRVLGEGFLKRSEQLKRLSSTQ